MILLSLVSPLFGHARRSRRLLTGLEAGGQLIDAQLDFKEVCEKFLASSRLLILTRNPTCERYRLSDRPRLKPLSKWISLRARLCNLLAKSKKTNSFEWKLNTRERLLSPS